ncbi:MAG: hypothetical protein AAF416_17170 [Pseudomonadota bacterium]
MATVDWPLPCRHKPILDSVREEAPNLLRRIQFEEGADRVRRTASRKPHIYRAEFECTPAERAVLRRWVYEDVDAGRQWFNLEAWVDGGYQWIEARIVPASDETLYEATPERQDMMRISLSYEVRELPRLGDDDYLCALVGGPDSLAIWAAELDAAIDIGLLAAMEGV